jgi:hypothetical protein
MEKREKLAGQPGSLGALWLLSKLTSGGVCFYPATTV